MVRGFQGRESIRRLVEFCGECCDFRRVKEPYLIRHWSNSLPRCILPHREVQNTFKKSSLCLPTRLRAWRSSWTGPHPSASRISQRGGSLRDPRPTKSKPRSFRVSNITYALAVEATFITTIFTRSRRILCQVVEYIGLDFRLLTRLRG